MCLSACGEPRADGPRILAGSDDLALIAPKSYVTLARVPIGSRINEILAVPPDVYLATWDGLTRVRGPLDAGSVPVVTDSLGTLDGVERDPRTGLLYLLFHPGLDPGEVTENHVVIEWDPSARRSIREWTVDLLSYDLHLDPGRGIVVMPLRGRRLWWVSFSADQARPIDLPPAPERARSRRRADTVLGDASHLRVGAVLPDGSGIVAVEQGLPERNRVWLLDPESGRIDGFDLPRSCQYQGGVLAPDGNTLVLNAIDAVEVVDLHARTERAWIALDRSHLRIAVGADGRECYLTAPGTDEQSGHVTTVDLVAERIAGRCALPKRAERIAFWSP